MSYDSTALKAAKLARKYKISPKQAWDQAAAIEFPTSQSSREKSCPKSSFLALCETGKIKGIHAGKYTRSELNKQYAIAAFNLLSSGKSKKYSPAELWKAVLTKLGADINKQHNSQMDVVLALWDNNGTEI